MSASGRLFILDPALRGRYGHGFAVDSMLARAFRGRGFAVTILANQTFEVAGDDTEGIAPIFDADCYARFECEPVSAPWRHFQVLNQRFETEAREKLAHIAFAPSDIVLVPTTNQNQLAGIAAWLGAMPRERTPFTAILLLLPSGLAHAGGTFAIADHFAALFYQFCFKRVKEADRGIRVFASGQQHSQTYSYLAGRPVGSHPILVDVDRAHELPPDPARVLLFAGEARSDKGVALLPKLAAGAARALPDVTFVVHVDDAMPHALREPGEALRAIASSLPNLILEDGYLSEARYRELIAGSACVVLPYLKERYAGNSSGVMWETIAIGRSLIVPRDTWLEREARLWGVPHATFESGDADGIVERLVGLSPQFGSALAAANVAAARFRAVNGPERFADFLLAEREASLALTKART